MYPDAKREKAYKLWQTGLSYTQVADMIGVNRSSVYAWVQQLEGKRLNKARKHVPTETKITAVRLYLREGWSAVAIQEELKLNNYQAIYRWAKDPKLGGVREE